MKVLYIHHNPDKGGSSNSLRYLLEELPKEIEIHISSPMGEAFERFKKVTRNLYPTNVPPALFMTSGVNLIWLRLLIEFPKIYSFNKQIRQILYQVKPDIVHLNEIGLISVAILTKKLGYKVVMHARVVPDHKYKWLTNFLSRQINKYVDQLICIDGSVSVALPIVKRKIIIYNPLQINQLSIQRKQHSDLNVLFLAGFLRQKGVFDVLNTAIGLKNEKGIHFFLAGGNIKRPAFFNSLLGRFLHLSRIYPNVQKIIEDEIRKHKLKNVTLKGYVEDISLCFNDADVLLLPTRMNEPSRSVFEAGVSGIPTIISLRDRVEDLVEDNVTGFIVREGDIEHIIKLLKLIKSDRELLNRLGDCSKKRYSILNDRKASASLVSMTYKSLYNNHN